MAGSEPAMGAATAPARARRDSYAADARQARAASREATRAAESSQAEISGLRATVEAAAVEQYVHGADAGTAALLLGSGDSTDAAVQAAVFDLTHGDVADLIDRLRLLEANQQELASDGADAARSAREQASAAATENRRLKALAERAERLRAEVEARRAALEQEAEDLRVADADLAAFIQAELAARAEAERAEAEAAALAAQSPPTPSDAPEVDNPVPAGGTEESPPQGGPSADPAPAAPPATSEGSSGSSVAMVWPLAGTVSSGFGNRVHPIYGTVRLHAGLDIAAPSGTPIAAAAGGVVLSAGWQGGYGETVIVDHGGGLTTVYPHMSGYAVATGDRVGQGQVVGYVGSTGLSTGPHLHFEVRQGGVAYDPLNFLP